MTGLTALGFDAVTLDVGYREIAGRFGYQNRKKNSSLTLVRHSSEVFRQTRPSSREKDHSYRTDMQLIRMGSYQTEFIATDVENNHCRRSNTTDDVSTRNEWRQTFTWMWK